MNSGSAVCAASLPYMKKGRGEAGGSALASFVSLHFGSLEAGSSASASSVSLPLVRLCLF